MGRISCSFCPLKFSDSGTLKYHFKNDHFINVSRKCKDELICKTDNCSRTFQRVRDLLIHIEKFHYIPKTSETCNPRKNSLSRMYTDCIQPLYTIHIRE